MGNHPPSNRAVVIQAGSPMFNPRDPREEERNQKRMKELAKQKNIKVLSNATTYTDPKQKKKDAELKDKNNKKKKKKKAATKGPHLEIDQKGYLHTVSAEQDAKPKLSLDKNKKPATGKKKVDDDDFEDYDDNDGGFGSGDEAFEDDVGESSPRHPFIVYTQAELAARQKGMVESVSGLLGVPEGKAAVLLLYNGWNLQNLIDAYRRNPLKVCKKAGVVVVNCDDIVDPKDVDSDSESDKSESEAPSASQGPSSSSVNEGSSAIHPAESLPILPVPQPPPVNASPDVHMPQWLSPSHASPSSELRVSAIRQVIRSSQNMHDVPESEFRPQLESLGISEEEFNLRIIALREIVGDHSANHAQLLLGAGGDVNIAVNHFFAGGDEPLVPPPQVVHHEPPLPPQQPPPPPPEEPPQEPKRKATNELLDALEGLMSALRDSAPFEPAEPRNILRTAMGAPLEDDEPEEPAEEAKNKEPQNDEPLPDPDQKPVFQIPEAVLKNIEPESPLKDNEFLCEICYCPADKESQVFQLDCNHLFCTDCWAGNMASKISEGPTCIYSKCMAPKCTITVDPDAWKKLAEAPVYTRYEKFFFNSFVDKNPQICWCPNPKSCSYAIMFTGLEKPTSGTVKCLCTYEFCSACREEKHPPLTCEQLSNWNKRCAQEKDAGNSEWIVSNAKPCPACKVPIEKNEGCMHMTCTQCNHEWCWLCRADWTTHGLNTGGFFACNRYETSEAKRLDAENDNRKNSIEKFLHYFERYTSHRRSRDIAEKLIEAAPQKIRDYQSNNKKLMFLPNVFLESAKLVQECRLILSNTYAFAYFLVDIKNSPEKNLFEFLQGNLEQNTERLTELTESPLDRISVDHLVNYSKATQKFKDNVITMMQKGMTQASPSMISLFENANNKK